MFVVIVKGVIIHNGKVLIVQRAQTEKIGAGSWECPGGKVEWGEELETALKREIKEETGLNVETERILYASSMLADQTKQFVTLIFLCKSEENQVILSNEHTNYNWVTKEQMRTLLAANILCDFEKNNVFSLEDWR